MCNVCRLSSPVSCQHFQRKTGRRLVGRSQGRESGGLGLFLALSPSHYMTHGSSFSSSATQQHCFLQTLGCALGAGGWWAAIGKAPVAGDVHSHPELLGTSSSMTFEKTSTASKKTCTVFCLSAKFSCFAGNINHFPMNACTGHEGAIIIVVI